MAKTKKHPPVVLDMTPMVDVAFLLLIFFMSTTQFKAPESIPIQLPFSHSVIELPTSEVIILSIGPKPENKIFWRLEPQPEVRIELSELEKALIEARIRNPRLRIAIKADKESEFGVVSDMMEIFQKTKNTRFNLVTNYEDDIKKNTTSSREIDLSNQQLAGR
ncbi:MAG: biopolymer transporter ExbD [candidate division Zixibacteria bacterium]|nr:biopolymer transporter ExbD [candidate division Zixibacteria bacterium]